MCNVLVYLQGCNNILLFKKKNNRFKEENKQNEQNDVEKYGSNLNTRTRFSCSRVDAVLDRIFCLKTDLLNSFGHRKGNHFRGRH